jgi:hypothetical protein
MTASTHSDSGSEIVQVPVPRQYLDTVYRALADAMADTSSAAPSGSVLPTQHGRSSVVPWNRDEIKQLRQAIRTKTPRSILDLTTAQPGKRVSLRDVENHAGRTYPQARADLAGFTQLVRRKFGRDNWPFSVEWLPGGFATYYCDSAEIAQWWIEP